MEHPKEADLLSALADFAGSSETEWLTGLLVAVLVAIAAYRTRALTVSGAIAAVLVGGTIVAAAGWWPGFVLVAFFATSSALSRYSASRSQAGEQARGGQRDAVQVLANGVVPVLCAIASTVAESPGPWLVALCAAVAGAASDTWGTEIGRLSRSRPRLITTWKPSPTGTSGAISTLGTLGSLTGALLIGLVAGTGLVVGWNVPGIPGVGMIATVTLAGFAGSIADSLLGATVQASYHCPACDQLTERRVHRCGTATVRAGGLRWMNNDTVNLLAIAISTGLGLAISANWS